MERREENKRASLITEAQRDQSTKNSGVLGRGGTSAGATVLEGKRKGVDVPRANGLKPPRDVKTKKKNTKRERGNATQNRRRQ